MGIEFRENMAYITETATVEEAEKFFEWLLETKEPVVDLKECLHMHTAVLQAILLIRPQLILPDDDELRAWLEAMELKISS